ncbi:MAG: hypothetical protein V4503_12465, partial [Gemmatimonadota bacterium]
MSPPRTSAATVLLATFLACNAAALAAQAVSSDIASARMEDLATFRREFFQVDQSYSATARAEASRRLVTLGERVGTISQPQFVLALEQIVALADNGHTLTIARGDDQG